MATKPAVDPVAAEKVDLAVQDVAAALEVQVVALAVVVQEATDLVVLTLNHRNPTPKVTQKQLQQVGELFRNSSTSLGYPILTAPKAAKQEFL